MDTSLVARRAKGSALPLRRRILGILRYSPREYIGIALNDAAADFTYVTVSYSGTAHGANTTVDRSVIFGQTIRVTNP